MKYRVEQLASACEVSVDTIRFYQSKGLLQGPAREGRVAIYGREHLERVRRIRALQARGLTLAAIGRVVSGKLGRADQDLAAAVAEAQAEAVAALTLEELAERSGVPAPLLALIERSGLPLGRVVDGVRRYSPSDVDLVRVGLRLLEAGLPLADLLALATRQDAAARSLAEEAVRLFDEHVRAPIKQASAGDDDAAAQRLVAAFGELLPAVTTLVAGHFRRVLLHVAQEHIERTGDAAEKRHLEALS